MFTRAQDNPNRERVYLFWNILLAILMLFLIASSTLVFVGVISKRCNAENEVWPSIATLVFEVISFVPTVFYGRKVLHEIVKFEKRSKLEEL